MYLNTKYCPRFFREFYLPFTSTYFTTPSSTYTNEISRKIKKKMKRCNHINLKTYFDKGRTALRSNWNIYLKGGEEEAGGEKKWTGNYMCGRNVNVRRSELMSFDEYYNIYMYVCGSDCVSHIEHIICGLMCLAWRVCYI